MRTPPRNPPGSLRVLVVEDNYLAAQAISLLLEDLGHRVVGPVSTVPDALATLDEHPVDLAMLDVDVRGRLVTPVADRVKALGRPIVFLSGLANHYALPGSYGEAPVLAKPFSEEDLRGVLQVVTDRPATHA